MTARNLLRLAVLSPVLTLSALSQQSAAGTATVSGHVIAGDTQRPARFAHVILFGIPAEVTATKKPDPDAGMEAQIAAMTAAMASLGKTQMVQLQTGTDGSFTATDVAPGDYYVFATAAGYITPLARVQALFQAGANPKERLPGVPTLHVAAQHPASVDIVMDRGAAVSGTILWEDGSPLSGAIMAATPAKSDPEKSPSQFGMLAMAGILNSLMNISDDQGHFRLSGLPPGDYVVQATIQAGQQTGLGAGMNLGKLMGYKPLILFAPAAFHKSGAKVVTLKAGEELRDQQVTLNLNGVHSVSGTVTSAADRHGINSGTVMLTDSNDKDFARSATLDAVGNFNITFVPPGTYTLKVSNAEDTEPDTDKKTGKEKKSTFFGASEKTLRSYADDKKSVVVLDSDLTAQNLELTIDKNHKDTAPDFSKLFSGDDDAPPAIAAPPPPPPPPPPQQV
jgi:hypothetical protein